MADVMVAVAAKILCREFPVAGNEPLLDPTQHLGTPLTPIPGVQRQVQVAREVPQVFLQWRRRRIPGGPERPLVVCYLRHLHQAPFGLVELTMVRLSEKWYAHQLA